MTKQVNANNTKAEILAAYNDVLKRLQTAQENKVDPVAEVTTRKNAETIAVAQKTINSNVEDQILALSKSVNGTLLSLASQITEKVDTLKNLDSAIKLKEADLKELVGIEREALALVALVNSQKELREQFNIESADKRAQLTSDLADITKQMSDLRLKTAEDLRVMKEQAAEERKREKEQYDYEFARDKKKAEDDLEDNLNSRRKAFVEEVSTKKAEFAAERKEIEERKSELDAREKEIKELKETVASFPIREAQIKSEVAEEVRKKEATTAAIKENAIKREWEAKLGVEQNKVSMLEETVRDLRNQLATANQKLDDAYNRNNSLAIQVAQSSAGSRDVDRIVSALDKNQK